MAASTGYTNGTLLGMFIETTTSGTTTKTKFANARTNDFEMTNDMIDASNKDSAGWKEFIAGLHSATMTCDGIMEEDGSVGSGQESPEDLLARAIANTPVVVVMGSGIVGDLKLTMNVLFSSFSLSAPDNDVATFSVKLQVTGAVTVGKFV
jgi:predicted secreted protein